MDDMRRLFVMWLRDGMDAIYERFSDAHPTEHDLLVLDPRILDMAERAPASAFPA